MNTFLEDLQSLTIKHIEEKTPLSEILNGMIVILLASISGSSLPSETKKIIAKAVSQLLIDEINKE